MVVGNFRCVHAPARRLSHEGEAAAPCRVVFEREQQGRNLRKNIFGNVAAARAGIGNQFRLVELLGDGERLFRREAVLGVRLLLQRCQVVQQGRVLHALLALDLRDSHPALFFERPVSLRRGSFLLPFLAGGESHHPVIRFPGGREMRLPKGFGRKTFILPIPLADHRQRGRLYTSE